MEPLVLMLDSNEDRLKWRLTRIDSTQHSIDIQRRESCVTTFASSNRQPMPIADGPSRPSRGA
jgi:hypothetical protein